MPQDNSEEVHNEVNNEVYFDLLNKIYIISSLYIN